MTSTLSADNPRCALLSEPDEIVTFKCNNDINSRQL